jgi:hypothetical protein
MRSILASCAFSLVLAGCSPATMIDKPPQLVEARLVCKKEYPMGSYVKKTRCTTVAERDADRKDALEVMDRPVNKAPSRR